MKLWMLSRKYSVWRSFPRRRARWGDLQPGFLSMSKPIQMLKWMLWVLLFFVACSPLPDDGNRTDAVLSSQESGRSVEQGVDPGARFKLTPTEVTRLSKQAESGNLEAIRKLVDFYSLAHDDPELAIPWLRRGAELGDFASMESLAHWLAAEGGPANCLESQRLLRSSLKLESDLGEQRRLQRHIDADEASCAQARAPVSEN